MTRPTGTVAWREVVTARMHSHAITSEKWWVLALSCGHHVERRVYRRAGSIEAAPSRVKCPECPSSPDPAEAMRWTPGHEALADAMDEYVTAKTVEALQ